MSATATGRVDWAPPTLNPRDWALYYAIEYGRQVLPCNPRPGDWAKAPLLPKSEGGQGYKDATNDAHTIDRWWKRWPKALIGCRPPWDEVVIDIDPRKQGASLVKLCTWLDNKAGIPIPRTRAVLSGRLDGGTHLSFKRPIDAETGEVIPLTEAKLPKILGDGYDLKTNLGYTIFPPSIHPDTGAPYEWRDNGLDDPVLDMPEALAKLLIRPASQYQGGTGRPNPRALEGILRKVAAERSKRNSLTFWGACCLIRGGYPEAAFDALHAAAASTGLPDWEITKAINSAQQSLGGTQ